MTYSLMQCRCEIMFYTTYTVFRSTFGPQGPSHVAAICSVLPLSSTFFTEQLAAIQEPFSKRSFVLETTSLARPPLSLILVELAPGDVGPWGKLAVDGCRRRSGIELQKEAG